MENKEMEMKLKELELEELQKTSGGADTDEELAYWEFRDKMLKKYGSIIGITDMKDYNILTYKKNMAKASREELERINKAMERREL